MALAYFKLAIIAAGIQFRDRMGGGTEYGDKVGEAVAPLVGGRAVASSPLPERGLVVLLRRAPQLHDAHDAGATS